MVKKIYKPNFFIVGAPRCGTTAMYDFLRQHPEIFMSAYKEPHYFATDLIPKTPWEKKMRTEKGYLSLFNNVGSEKAVGEASVYYLYSRCAIKNIYKFDPNAKIIIMLRKPLDVIHSLFYSHLNNGYENIKTLEKAVHLEKKRKQGGGIPINSILMDCAYYYSDIVRFGGQLKRCYEYFPKKQILIIKYSDFKLHTDRVYEKVCEFLGVSQNFKPEFKIVNPTRVAVFPKLSNFISNPPDFLKKIVLKTYFVSKYFFRLIERINSRNSHRVTVMSDKLKDELIHSLNDDLKLLTKFTNTDRRCWI